MSWSSPKPNAKQLIISSDFICAQNPERSIDDSNHSPANTAQMPSLNFFNNLMSPNSQLSNSYIEHGQKALVANIVKRINTLKLKVIAFDFDQTIVSVHTGGTWPDSAEKLAEFVRPCFRYLLPELLKCENLFVCVVTFSSQEELIREVLRLALPSVSAYQLSKVVIKGNTKEFIDRYGFDNCFSNGKELHIATCKLIFEAKMRNMKIQAEDVLLIDDDPDNIHIAQQSGHLAFLVGKNVSLLELCGFLEAI